MFLQQFKIWMKLKFMCYSFVFLLYFLHEMSFLTIFIKEFVFNMVKYTLKCGTFYIQSNFCIIPQMI